MWLKPILLDSTEIEHPSNLIYMSSVALKVLSLFESKIVHNIVILKKKNLNIDVTVDTLATFWSILTL